MFAWFVGLWIGVSVLLVLVNGTRSLTRSGQKVVTYVAPSAAEYVPRAMTHVS